MLPAPDTAPPPPPPKPRASPFWRAVMRLTGTLAIALFLLPTVYVIKYYAADSPREQQRAQLVSTSALIPALNVNAIAPPLAPISTQNAADFYVPAIQSYADRTRSHAHPELLLLPTSRELGLILQAAHCTHCQFFEQTPAHQPVYTFHDPDNPRPHPYRAPLTPQETYRYLSYAGALAAAVRNLATLPGSPVPQRTLALAIIRFGSALEADQATRTHIAVSTAVQRIGLRLLRTHPPTHFQDYIDSREAYDEALQAKYALLEPASPQNIALQERVARTDSAPLWRREAVWALGQTLSLPRINYTHPLECLTAKETLSHIATRDLNPSVRDAAQATLSQIAAQGAVIRRQ